MYVEFGAFPVFFPSLWDFGSLKLRLLSPQLSKIPAFYLSSIMLGRSLENIFREKAGMDVKLTSIFPPLKDWSPSIPVCRLYILLSVFYCFGKWDGLIMSYSIMIGTIYYVNLHLISHIIYGTILSCFGITNLETSLVFCQHERRMVT